MYTLSNENLTYLIIRNINVHLNVFCGLNGA